MITYTLVILMSVNGTALSSTIVPGFTTQQACESAKAQINLPSSVERFGSYTKTCVANHI